MCALRTRGAPSVRLDVRPDPTLEHEGGETARKDVLAVLRTPHPDPLLPLGRGSAYDHRLGCERDDPAPDHLVHAQPRVEMRSVLTRHSA
jgi:hypothetical protein